MAKTAGAGFSGSVDSFYDPEFTVQISRKMQVPDKISVIEGADVSNERPKSEESKVFMHVPERILVAAGEYANSGGNEHIAAREMLPELRLETNMSRDCNPQVLTTPPRVLTLNEYDYPSIGEDQTFAKKEGDLGNCVSQVNETSHGIVRRAPAEELKFIGLEVKMLRKRISQLEMENQARNNREIILYSFGVVYFLLKGIMWLNRHI